MPENRNSGTFDRVRLLVAQADVRVSDHGYDRLIAEGILASDVLDSVGDGVVVEDYPDHPRGPCVLVLQRDDPGRPLHVVWGIPKGYALPAVMVTAYRPNPGLWQDGYTRRRT